jgi:hypothetical protein
LFIPLVFPATGALPLGHSRYAMWRGYPKQLAIIATVLDKCLIYADVIPRYIKDFDTRFALCVLPGA